MAERFLIRNYGPSRNLEDGKGSYVFIERDRVRATSDPELAKVLASYPQVHVTDRGEDLPVSQPPVSAPLLNPESENDEDEAKDEAGNEEEIKDIKEDDDEEDVIDYDSLTVSDLREIAQERGLATTRLKKAELVKVLQDDDAS